MQSGILGARTIFKALESDDVSSTTLKEYDKRIRDSFIHKDLYKTRNMRLAFKSGFYRGGVKASLMTLTRGGFPGSRIEAEEDAAEPRSLAPGMTFTPDGKITFSKTDAVYRSGNVTRDDVPLHLLVGEDVTPEMAEFYSHMCPAGVYERRNDGLVVNAPNCVDCKATDILGPRWTPREGGSGPKYKRM